MRRSLLAVGLVMMSLALASYAWAAPVAQEQRPVIAQPEPDAVVRGVVQIVGTATHPQFQRYELYYTPWPVAGDNAWIFIGADAHYQQQPLGLLGTWDSRAVPDGAYALRVRVVKADSNYYDSDPRRVVVANNSVPDTATPSPSPNATETPAVEETSLPEAPATATIIVDLPMDNTPTPPAQAAGEGGEADTATPAATPLLSDGSGDSSGLDSVGQTISIDRLKGAARTAATYTIGAFAVLGLFFGFKALLVWLWNRMRP